MRRVLGTLALMILACASAATASATLLLEEPYGKLGFFTATGHAAVYLSGVCAETPVILRRCAPGETGVVISRYDGVDGYDWIAIPLVPYLYAVERPEDVPLFADARMTAFLRDRYRRKYLEDIVPDAKNGQTPGGNWYELVGSSYDRTIYGFEIETTPEQDAALIRKLNASPNQSHFRTVSKNCADFAKDIINFYYPKALHRSVVADVGITTPKQMAKGLTKYCAHHPQIHFSRLIIPQVPGSMPRSSAVHGVVESFLKSKKYFVPSAVVSPIFAGCVFAVYEGTGAGRFEPGRDAKVYVVGGDPEPPLDHEDLRAYQLELKHLLAGAYPETSARRADRAWGKLQSRAEVDVDDQGRPVLEMEVGDNLIEVGDTADNIMDGTAPPQLLRQLLEARLESELLRRSPRGISETAIDRDWNLLQQTMEENDSSLASRSTPRSDVRPDMRADVRGNRP
ncbi:MAG TPA: hypothetical protein VMD99_02040 [Terriglobales bacterium]|nr:hypothetical protein [Terriglobales bacterium]